MPEFTGRLRTPRLASAPASPVSGELYFDTATNKLYWYNGTAWVAAEGGVGGGGGVDYKGAYAAATPYIAGDVARYQGVDYLAVNPSTGSTPPAASPLGVPVPFGMTKLFDLELSAVAANFDITNIPIGYAHLQLIAQLRGTDGAGQATNFMRFNNDSANNYADEYLTWYASTATPTERLAASSIFVGNCPAAGAPANLSSFHDILIPNYLGTAFHKAVRSFGGNRNGTVTTTIRGDLTSGYWLSTVAINRITIFPGAGQYAIGSRLTLYGIDVLTAATLPNVPEAAPSYGTSLPTSPMHGQQAILVDSLTAPTYAWRFRYDSTITDAYKWVFIGGDAKMARLETDYPTNAALSMTVPRPGYYNLDHGCSYYLVTLDTIYVASLTADGAGSYAYFNVGRAVSTMAGYMGAGSSSQPNVLVSSTIAQSSNVTGSNRIERRWIKAMPVRVS